MNKQPIAVLLASTCLAAGASALAGVQAATPALPVVSDGIAGVVTSSKGPEAGVWVIAETTELPTRLIKIVVTDEQGRYVLPELPKANYQLWVRGYGLVDSSKVAGSPGKNVNLAATVAPDAKAAAQVYPANYWFAMIDAPAPSLFPGTGAAGNGIPPTITSQQHWFAEMREECGHCHQVGDKATRELVNNSLDGWAERIAMARPNGDQAIGNHGAQQAAAMKNTFAGLGYEVTLKIMASWTKRIAAGETPRETPPRPSGIERNVVLTLWDWGNGRFVHDTSSTDRRNPTMNGYGPVYSGAVFTGALEALDPKTHVPTEIPYGVELDQAGALASLTEEHDINMQPHNTMLDAKGRVWASDMGRSITTPMSLPSFCANEAGNVYAKYYPRRGRSAAVAVMYDPAVKKLTGVPVCYGLHHLMFAKDRDETLFFTGPGSDVIGWLATKTYDETKSAEKSIGWCPMVLDTNEAGNGAGPAITPDRSQWNKPDQPLDPKKDTQILGGQYGIDTGPADDSVWYAQNTAFPSAILRFEKGANPPQTCKTEKFEPPKLPSGDYAGFGGRGVGIDTKGIAWVTFANGKMGRFDRGKCKVLRGPAATGQHCPEGWTFTDLPGPRIANSGNVQADWNYLTWVDQYNTLGLGDNVVVTPGTWSDSMLAVMPDTGKVITMRVPYPMGAYARGVDGRIDDAKAGWKGRGLWTTYAMIPVWHQEGGDDGAGPQLVHFQIRPDPLAY